MKEYVDIPTVVLKARSGGNRQSLRIFHCITIPIDFGINTHVDMGAGRSEVVAASAWE